MTLKGHNGVKSHMTLIRFGHQIALSLVKLAVAPIRGPSHIRSTPSVWCPLILNNLQHSLSSKSLLSPIWSIPPLSGTARDHVTHIRNHVIEKILAD